MTEHTELAHGDGYSTGNCLLRPTHRHTTQLQHPCTCLYNFCGHCVGGAAHSHGSTWAGVVYCSFSGAHFEFRSERGRWMVLVCAISMYVHTCVKSLFPSLLLPPPPLSLSLSLSLSLRFCQQWAFQIHLP